MLSEQALAAKTGTSVEVIRRLVDLGLISRGEIGDGYPESLVPRVRLAMHLEESGISLQDVSRVVAEGSLSLSFADRLFGRPVAMTTDSAGQVVSDLGVSADFLAEVQIALGMGPPNALIREDDARLLRMLDQMLTLGVDETVLIRFFQAVVDNLRRVAQAGREFWITGVEEPLLASGVSQAELLEIEAGPAPESQLIAETMLQLLWNRFIEQEIFQAAVQHLETALEKAGVSAPRERHPAAVAFLDLTGYTDLTERAGDEVAAERARRLVDLIRPAAARHGGRVVKTLGDGAMFHFQDPANAVRCGLTLVEAVPEVGLPLARFGVNAGPLIIKDADYYGRTVNIAARIVDYARPREVLASVDVVENSEGSDILFEEVGPVSLKGVPDPVVIYKAVAAPAL